MRCRTCCPIWWRSRSRSSSSRRSHGSASACCESSRTMKRREDRILTTHAGSLPRPAALTRLYAQRVRGEPVDAALIEAAGRAAVRDSVAKQIDTGLDLVNDGEQSRESFVLYMRHRLTGLGGEGSRVLSADLDDYPEYKRQFLGQAGAGEKVSNRAQLPKAIGAISYSGQAAVAAECADFKSALAAHRGYTDAFLTAPSPGIIATIVQNEHY